MTTTDIVVRDDGLAPEVIGSAYQLAERVAQTEFVPGALRNRPEAVMACILTGREVGIGPMQALSKIHVVDGRPAMAAELMRSLALSAGHEIWYEEKSSTRVTVAGRRNGSDKVSKVTWTLDDAKRAGIQGKNNWRKYPRAMLTARATSELCRDLFADCLGGVSYAVEELQDGGFEDTTGEGAPIDETPAKSTAAKRGTVRRSPPQRRTRATAAPRADDGPLLPHELDDDDEDVVDAEIVDDDEEDLEQLKKAQLALRCKDAGLPTSGNKDELIARLTEHRNGADLQERDQSAPEPSSPEHQGDAPAPEAPDDVHTGTGDGGHLLNGPGSITAKQKQRLSIRMRELGMRGGESTDAIYRAAMRKFYSVSSIKELSEQKASALIRVLEDGQTTKGGEQRTPEDVAARFMTAGAEQLQAEDEADVTTDDDGEG